MFSSLIQTIEAKNEEIYDVMRGLERAGTVQFGKKHPNYDAVIVFEMVSNECMRVWPHSFGTRRAVLGYRIFVTGSPSSFVIDQWVVNEDNNYGFFLDDVKVSTVGEAIDAIYAAFDQTHPDRVRAAYDC
jgi:hypothetical protein